ncbi:MAG: TetR family transcriptional regulator [Gordonia sp. (in: high G+C Gram-positive bacteria)]|uniref:TetR/AcrR family transcriptional regulator n=1 Tax=Gordonia sp. (in: high G+C Gram-positive bacteria) TaxID=84139 RepID=UPI0039E31CD5
MTPPQSATRRPPTKSELTRQRILNAAAQVLVRDGYTGARLAAIAEAAGLQIGSLYYHFDNRDQLVQEVLEYGIDYTFEHVSTTVAALPDDTPPRETLSVAIRAFLEAIIGLGSMSPAHNRTFRQLPEEMRRRLAPRRKEFGLLWQHLIADAIESGDLRADTDPYLLQLFIVHTAEQAPDWPESTKRSPAELAATVERLIMDGVSVHPDSSSRPADEPHSASER